MLLAYASVISDCAVYAAVVTYRLIVVALDAIIAALSTIEAPSVSSTKEIGVNPPILANGKPAIVAAPVALPLLVKMMRQSNQMSAPIRT